MKKKLLSLLLSMAMMFTSADTLVLAAERPAELQTAAGEVREETPAFQEGTAEQPEPEEGTASEQESTESDTAEKPAENTETETAETESTEEVKDPEEETDSTEEATDPEEEADSVGEATELETEDSKVQSQEEGSDLEKTAADAKLQVDYHSISEIIEFLNQEKAGKADAVTYTEKPDLTAPYHAGALSDTTLESAAAMIRQIRFIAGLPYEMQLNDEYNHVSQAAALLSGVNQKLSQEPSRPGDMSGELFEQGREGATNSSLAYTSGQSQTLNGTIIETWMADQNEQGCRGQLLKPSMEEIGFGAVNGGDGMYSAMYTADHSGKDTAVFGVAWPAQNMPVDYFDREYPWSVSTGETLEASDICVTLTREADGKEWFFSEEKSDGLFFVENDDCGQSGCIYFRPETSDISEYVDGDIFQVEITKDEKPYLGYRVRFFSFSKEEEKLTAPEASIASGEAVAKDTRLVLTSKEAASVYYTLDDTTPTVESTEYTEPIAIEADVTVKAVAIKDGYEDSDTVTLIYTVEEDSPVRYTVTFESNGGTVLPAQSIEENEKVILPEQPVKEGSSFGGWYQEAEFENEWDFETDVVEADITLYAKWIGEEETVEEPVDVVEPAEEAETVCIVTYDMQGIGEQIAPETINEGELLAKPDIPVAEGYTFEAWYQEPECRKLWDFETDVITQDTVLYAKWIQADGVDVSANDLYQATAEEVRIDLSAELTDTRTNKITPRVYNGKAYEPSIKVTAFNGKKRVTLKKNRDYKLQYANNVHAGEDKASVTILGIGDYTGSVTKTFTITPKSVKKLKIMTGSKLPGDKGVAIVIYDGTVRLNNGWFLAEYTDAQDPKKAKVTITPKVTTTDYTGSVTSKLTVYDVPKEKYINSARQEITGDTLYTGKAIKRNVKLTIGETELRYNKDYKVQYKNNVNAGTAAMIITGKGQYKGKIVSTFNIGKVDVHKKELAEDVPQHVTIADISPRTFSGREQKPAVTIKTMGNKKLALNKDYTVTYSNNIHAGTATITIAGIGNNCNGKTSIKFKIEPQQIKKAAVKLIRGKNDVPNTIALTYNKITLQEYADYIITQYGEMKNKKIPVTIEGRGDFAGNVTKRLSVEAPKEEPGSEAASVSKNINRQNYGSFEGCIVNSYLQKNDDGTFMRVEHIGNNNVCIESYTADQKFNDKKMIKMELPKFGGFYSGKDYYFLVFGQENPKEDNSVEVIRVVKYDKNWERKGSVGIFGGNTFSPFKNGSLRMVEYGDTLYIRTCHQMYTTSDGNRHQANIAFSID
ncbi:MAG: InlB B-repeat-containing protein, partial [Lachnospiraceae bacterium]|nr:InlB B-repeat-containing protein [Lachnospiraceae bacterium]